jgi:hypothetical protein
MKFTVIAILAAVSAVKVTQLSTMAAKHGRPTPEEVFDQCDTSGDNKLSLAEAVKCATEHGAPQDKIDEMTAEWPKDKVDGATKEEMKAHFEAK